MKSSKNLKRDLEEMLAKSKTNAESMKIVLGKIINDNDISKARKITEVEIANNKQRKDKRANEVALQVQSYKSKKVNRPDKKRP